MKENTAIYALYSNNKFVSWLYGAFCQFTTVPKFYLYDEQKGDKQSEIVLENLRYKIKNVTKKSIPENSPNPELIKTIDALLSVEDEIIKQHDNLTLGVFFVKEEELTQEFLKELSKNGVPNNKFEV